MTSNTPSPKKTAARRKPAATETPKTRISTARHRKAANVPDVEPVSEIASDVFTIEDRHAAVSKIAYGFWEMRGFQDGDPASDWFRAEEEFARRTADQA